MGKRKRRIAERQTPENRREYQGEKAAAPLVNWLNITTDKDGRQRIINIVSLFFRWFLQTAKVKPDDFIGEDGHWYERETPESKKSDQLQEELWKALEHYRMVPSVDILGPDVLGRGRYRVITYWIPIPGSKLASDMRRASESNLKALSKSQYDIPGAQRGEDGALDKALQLFESGWIWKIRRCRCGIFFFAKFRHQRFCSQKCRIAEFQSSDYARKKRNDYARMLYHRHKALDEGKVG